MMARKDEEIIFKGKAPWFPPEAVSCFSSWRCWWADKLQYPTSSCFHYTCMHLTPPPQPVCLLHVSHFTQTQLQTEKVNPGNISLIYELTSEAPSNNTCVVKFNRSAKCCFFVLSQFAYQVILPLHRLEVVQKWTETTTAFKDHGAKAPVVDGDSVRLIFKELRGL